MIIVWWSIIIITIESYNNVGVIILVSTHVKKRGFQHFEAAEIFVRGRLRIHGSLVKVSWLMPPTGEKLEKVIIFPLHYEKLGSTSQLNSVLIRD